MEKKRYHLLDILRGICIIIMIIYHGIYDLSEIFGMNYDFLYEPPMEFLRKSTVSVFILLAGISCQFSRNNWKRGFKTLLCALVITAFTALFMPSELIIFGILHFFACCMLLYAASASLLKKIPTWVGLAIFLLIYLLTLDIASLFSQVPHSFLLYALGFPSGYHSADYYPLLPWMFLFFVGSFLGRFFKEQRVPAFFEANPLPILSFIGKHTMIIYLLHQPVVYGILWLWFAIF